MIHEISYTERLDSYVENDDLIPYRLHPNARYRTNCYYWICAENKWFKIEEVEYDFSTPIPILDHVIVESQDNLRSWLCTDLSIFDYRLERDKFNIKNASIINSGKSYSGGEIEYWFFKQKITSLDEKYREFWKYLDTNGGCRIDPNKFYYITAREHKGIYVNVRLILDPTQEKFKRLPNKRRIIKNDSPITHDSIQRERIRRRRSHESRSSTSSKRNNR